MYYNEILKVVYIEKIHVCAKKPKHVILTVSTHYKSSTHESKRISLLTLRFEAFIHIRIITTYNPTWFSNSFIIEENFEIR